MCRCKSMALMDEAVERIASVSFRDCAFLGYPRLNFPEIFLKRVCRVEVEAAIFAHKLVWTGWT